ncbi:tripeptidyl peptidase A protein [Rutstroemia sp. NJR-2017a WRK4]|nr:tripeptidyl peptidase A protein [Rutstroemia sp. NJR-2017a WRK4]
MSLRFAARLAIVLSLLFKSYAAVREKLAAVPNGWEISEPLSSTTEIKLSHIQPSISLSRDLCSVDSKFCLLWRSPRFGWNKTTLWVFDRVQNCDHIMAQKERIERVDTSYFSVDFVTSIEKIHHLFNTTFAAYENNGIRKVRTTEYSIPDNLVQHIDVISPTVFFGIRRARTRPTSAPSFLETRLISRATTQSANHV